MSRQTAVAALVVGAIATAMVSLGILLNAKRNREQPVVTYPCPVCPPCAQVTPTTVECPVPPLVDPKIEKDLAAWNAGYTQGREDWRCEYVWKVPDACHAIVERPGMFSCLEAQP